MPRKAITSVSGIGPKTEQELRRALRGSRSTGRIGDKVSITEAERFENVTRTILAADQQRALAKASGTFRPDRSARQRSSSSGGAAPENNMVSRGDFRVPRDDFQAANETFNELPEERQQEDRGSREPVTTDFGLWQDNIGALDFPGIDTPNTRKPRANEGDPLLNDTGGQRRPREAWRESEPELSETDLQLGREPPAMDAERTGIMRTSDDGTFVRRPVEPDKGEETYRSANGLFVGESVQDPTIGRDPETGEFVDRPLDEEPVVNVPDPFGFFAGGGAPELTQEDRDVIQEVERSNFATGERAEQISQLRLSDEPTEGQQEAFIETADSLINFRDEIEDPARTDTDFIESDTLDRIESLRNRF